ncbi:MAG: hypothetical protein Q9218_003040 [Villophora microphyllina]
MSHLLFYRFDIYDTGAYTNLLQHLSVLQYAIVAEHLKSGGSTYKQQYPDTPNCLNHFKYNEIERPNVYRRSSKLRDIPQQQQQLNDDHILPYNFSIIEHNPALDDIVNSQLDNFVAIFDIELKQPHNDIVGEHNGSGQTPLSLLRRLLSDAQTSYASPIDASTLLDGQQGNANHCIGAGLRQHDL